jgi:riboflavin biosynthesis pyrimidine reductase
MASEPGLTRLGTLFDATAGPEVSLPSALGELYGRLRFPAPTDRPYVVSNFVTTLDGVVALNAPGLGGGGAISGFDAHDHVVMGLLRAVADAVVVGAGTLRGSPEHLWTADYIYPPLASAYDELRASLHKPSPPLNVVVTATGELDLGLPVFQSGRVPVMLVTSEAGARHLRRQRLPDWAHVAVAEGASPFESHQILAALGLQPDARVLVEGGPHLLGNFLNDGCLDEQFLTVAP